MDKIDISLIVSSLSYQDLYNLLLTSKSIYVQSPYLITQWSLGQDQIIKNFFFHLYAEKLLNANSLLEIPKLHRCEKLLDCLKGYVESLQTNLKFSKKDILGTLYRYNLITVIPDLFNSIFIDQKRLTTPLVSDDREVLYLDGSVATYMNVLYSIILSGFCGTQQVSEYYKQTLHRWISRKILLVVAKNCQRCGLMDEIGCISSLEAFCN